MLSRQISYITTDVCTIGAQICCLPTLVHVFASREGSDYTSPIKCPVFPTKRALIVSELRAC